MRNSKYAASLLIARAKSLQLHHHTRHSYSSPSTPLVRFWFPSLCSSKTVVATRLFSSYYSLEQFSDDEYDCDFENQQASSTVVNVDEWKWKLSMLLRSEKDQEIISRDRKDRRDYEQIANLAKRMGLYSELFGKVVVASKVPLPNYRPDLDDKRPQREVVIPLSLQRRVEGLLQEYLDRLQLNYAKTTDTLDDMNSTNQVKDIEMDENCNSFVDESVMEKILQKRSLRMRNMQRAWQESPEGRKMLEFRKSLPSFKEKQGLLQAIAHNQVIVVSGETGCGKTTQLPQYVLESEIESGRGAFCSIICTQPRRISAMAVSERVSAERGESLGETDLLPRRRDLRLVLMSATLNAELFSKYFGDSPTFHIPGFTYPVRAHFLEDVLEMTGYKLTSFNQIDDYGQEKMWKTQKQLAPRKRKNQITALVEDALSKSSFENYSSRARDSLASWTPDCIGFNLIEAVLCHICRKERSGAVLVFMTGWEDISSLRDQLKAHPLLGDPNRVLLLTCHGSMATSEQKLIFEKPPPNIRKVILATNMAEASITINDVVFVVDCGKAKETTYDALNNTPCLLPSWISQASARQASIRIHGNDVLKTTERRGRAGRVQPGECYHLYPRCVYEAFSEYQLPELLRTPLNSLCLQIKSLQVESIGEFLSAALQAPEPRAWGDGKSFKATPHNNPGVLDSRDILKTMTLQQNNTILVFKGDTLLCHPCCWRKDLALYVSVMVYCRVQNAIDFLKMIGALDEKESLTNLGKFLAMLPVDPKLGKMLIMGAIFRCFDPVLTIVSGLSVRDPFLLPQDKRDSRDDDAGASQIQVAAVAAGRGAARRGCDVGRGTRVGCDATGPRFFPSEPVSGDESSSGDDFSSGDDSGDPLAGTAKSRFSAKDYSDHMALVRAYEGWKDAEREGSAYEYCWRNFLSAQTLQAIHSLRKQFSFILKEAGLVDADASIINRLSHNQSLVRAIICSGLFPGIASVVHRETSMSFKTMDDGQVLLYANSVNARYQTIPYPWLVFGEKVKVNAVFIRDSTGVSDSILIIFGGALSNGIQAGHLKMLDGYVDLFMDPSLADCYLKLKEELNKLIQKKLEDPSIDIHKEGKYLMLAVQELVSGDQCEGRFVFGRESRKPKASNDENKFTKDGTNPKSLLQTLLMRAGHSPPKYKTKHLKTNEFRALVEFKGMQFVGKPKRNKQLAERDAAIEALAWLTHTSDNHHHEDDNSPPDVTDNMLKLLGKRRKSKRRHD
ncbi:hypothetical protein Fmac_020172 [Flemingia macrophylla]|uniref:RNA helicase n=1 Tax=Flemingia macrophylla TaxID=520843 RepID=A0ABD1LT86_9FABA